MTRYQQGRRLRSGTVSLPFSPYYQSKAGVRRLQMKAYAESTIRQWLNELGFSPGWESQIFPDQY